MFTFGFAVAVTVIGVGKLQVMFCMFGLIVEIGAIVFSPIVMVWVAWQLVTGSVTKHV